MFNLLKRVISCQIKMATFDYDYLKHAKKGYISMHLSILVIALVLAWIIHPICSFLVVPVVISWNYFFLFDKNKTAYQDNYMPRKYEYFGTVYDSLLIGYVVIRITAYLVWNV